MTRPQYSRTGAERGAIFIDHKSIQFLAQIIPALLDLAQQSAETQLVVESLHTSHITIVAFVLLDGEIDGIYEDGDLSRGSQVGGGVSGEDLGQDDEG